MLRSLDPAFKCVTLPYFNYVQLNLDYINGKCTNIESCSPQLRELGGSTKGSIQRVSFDGNQSVYYRCVNTSPVNHLPGGCVMRGNWTLTYFPPDLNFNYIKQTIFQGSDVTAVNNDIEYGPHSVVHNILNGIMVHRYQSPTEPMFWSHHSVVDLMYVIYHQCRVKKLNLTNTTIATNKFSFQGCSTPQTNVSIGANSLPTMKIAINASYSVDAEDPSQETAIYFTGIPRNYYELTDATQLGTVNSYSYELPGLLGDLFQNCENSGSVINPPAPKITPTLSSRLDELTPAHVVVPMQDPNSFTFMNWRVSVTQQATLQRLTPTETESEIEKMLVMYYENCLPGGFLDFSESFKADWGVHSTLRSKSIVEAIVSGTDSIRVVNWAQYNLDYFGCRGDKKNHSRSTQVSK